MHVTRARAPDFGPTFQAPVRLLRLSRELEEALHRKLSGERVTIGLPPFLQAWMTLPCLAALLLTHELNFQSGSSQDEHFEHFWLRIDTILQCPGGWEVMPLGLRPFPSWCAQGPLPWQLPGVSPSRGHRITHHHGPLPVCTFAPLQLECVWVRQVDPQCASKGSLR